jgi:pimeloyl-ACP methyl ester carboxylesterase
MRRLVGAGALLLAVGLVPVWSIAATFYLAGNGLTLGLVAFVAIPAIPGLVGCGLLRRRAGMLHLAFLLVITALAYGRWRVSAASDTGRLVVCADGVCPTAPPWVSRLIREDEAWNAAIQLAWFLGILNSNELASLAPASEAAYRSYEAWQGPRPSVNGLLLTRRGSAVTELVGMPTGRDRVGALVFLHGFGGQISPCVGALAASELGRNYAIVAPVLDWRAEWWMPEGERVLVKTLDTLPARIDRTDLWLVGLSNGANGASRLASRPEVAERFRGLVLLMGGASTEFGEGRRPLPTLLIPARHDSRFPFDGLERLADELRAAGADVTVSPVEGDHFALMADPDTVTKKIASWLPGR